MATKGPELVTEEDRPIALFSVRAGPGVLGGVASPVDRASTSLNSDSLAGLRTSLTDTKRRQEKRLTLTITLGQMNATFNKHYKVSPNPSR